MIKAQGLDFGPYTKFSRKKIKPEHQIDFLVVGCGWGARKNKMWDHNLEVVKDEKRRMIYQFFTRKPSAEEQTDFCLEQITRVRAHAIFIDWERSEYGVREDLAMQTQVGKYMTILRFIKENYAGRVGIYSNPNDYLFLQNFSTPNEWPLWIASPDESPNNEPSTPWWWSRMERAPTDYVIDQWAWQSYAGDLGAMNDKKSMDRDQFNGTVEDLDYWLRIGPEPKTKGKPQRDLILDEV